jgi:hypothetical protein
LNPGAFGRTTKGKRGKEVDIQKEIGEDPAQWAVSKNPRVSPSSAKGPNKSKTEDEPVRGNPYGAVVAPSRKAYLGESESGTRVDLVAGNVVGAPTIAVSCEEFLSLCNPKGGLESDGDYIKFWLAIPPVVERMRASFRVICSN